MLPNSECRRLAKEKLGGKIFGETWMLALALCLVQSVVIGAATAVTYGAGALIITGPISIGATSVILSLMHENKPIDIGQMFNDAFGNGQFGRNLLVGLMKQIFVMLWSLLLFIPGIIMAYAYYMAEYLAVTHPEYDWRTCIKESRRLMKGHKWDAFCLDLSFIGWYIVGGLCLGVGTLWVTPYHFTARMYLFDSIANVPDYDKTLY